MFHTGQAGTARESGHARLGQSQAGGGFADRLIKFVVSSGSEHKAGDLASLVQDTVYL